MINLDSVLKKINLPLGEDDFKEPLSILLHDYSNASSLNRLGALTFENGIKEKLRARAQLLDFVNSNNLEEPSSPIIISGLPRSGTTYLFDIMYCSEIFRGPLTWELFEMMPVARSQYQRAYKQLKTELRLALFRALVPRLMNIHHMKSNLPEECQLITALDFKSISFAYSARVPNYKHFIGHCDYSSAFMWHKRFLQAMETTIKPSYWLLKDPCHIQHIEEILNTYPNAKFVFIHRSPIEVIGSISSLTYTLRSAFSKSVDCIDLGKESLSFWGHASKEFLSQRRQIPASNMIDINFHDFTNNPIEITEAIFTKFNIGLSKETREKMLSFAKQKTQLSKKHNYSLDEFGLKDDQVNEMFSAYRNEFNL